MLQLHPLTLFFYENRERVSDSLGPFLRGSWGGEQALNNTRVRKNYYSGELPAHLLPEFKMLYEISVAPGYWRRAELFKTYFILLTELLASHMEQIRLIIDHEMNVYECFQAS